MPSRTGRLEIKKLISHGVKWSFDCPEYFWYYFDSSSEGESGTGVGLGSGIGSGIGLGFYGGHFASWLLAEFLFSSALISTNSKSRGVGTSLKLL